MTRAQWLEAIREGRHSRLEAQQALNLTRQAISQALKYKPTGKRAGRPRKEAK